MESNWYVENIEKKELLWLAGLWDAEGCFSEANGGKPSPHGGKQMRGAISITDYDILHYLADLCNFTGTIGKPKRREVHHKQQYSITICGKNARELAIALAPYLSDRRRIKQIYPLTELYQESAWDNLHSYQKLYWVIGYTEGEGCIHEVKSNNSKFKRSHMFRLATTDEDAVERVANILNVRKIYQHSPSSVAKDRKPQWVVQIYRRSKLYEVYSRLYPFMFSKKRNEIDVAFDFWNTHYPEMNAEAPVRSVSGLEGAMWYMDTPQTVEELVEAS